MKLHCLIIEDEPLAAEVLSDYIRQVPFLLLAGHCSDAVQALDFLKQHRVDVLFLDLHLPGLKGFDLLRTLPSRPQVIITSAYHQYALEGYEFQVTDYLLKPIEFSRFLTAVNKLEPPGSKNPAVGTVQAAPSQPFLFVYTDKKQVRILTDEILYVESEKDYLKIFMKSKTLVIRQPLFEFEKLLPPGNFLRIHRSYLIRLAAMDAFDAAHVEVAGKKLPIGRQFKETVLERLKNAAS